MIENWDWRWKIFKRFLKFEFFKVNILCTRLCNFVQFTVGQNNKPNVCKALSVSWLERVPCYTLYIVFWIWGVLSYSNSLNFLPLPFPITHGFFSYQTIKQQLVKDKVGTPYIVIVRFKINVIKPEWNAGDLDLGKRGKLTSYVGKIQHHERLVLPDGEQQSRKESTSRLKRVSFAGQHSWASQQELL